MNKIIGAKLKQFSQRQFLFYFPYLSLTEQLVPLPKKSSQSKKSRSKRKLKVAMGSQMKIQEQAQRKPLQKEQIMQYSSVQIKDSPSIVGSARFLRSSPTKAAQTQRNRPERNVKSATSRSVQIANKPKDKVIFESQAINTDTSLMCKYRSFQIPGVKFRSKERTYPQVRLFESSHSSAHYQSQKMINIQLILQRNCKNYSQLMLEYAKRSNIKSQAMIFVFNSQDTWLKKVLVKRGWIQNPNKESRAYHLLWSYKFPKIMPFSSQFVNHYINGDVVTSKYRLHQMLQKYHCTDFQPITFDLAEERQDFCEQFSKREVASNNIWILKSRMGSKGAGIVLSKNYTQIVKNKTKLVQKYIQSPLLLNLSNYRKFDIRIWVLVTGSKNISIYYYPQFYCRLCSLKYDTSLEQLRNEQVHLTNYSVNRNTFQTRGEGQESVIFSDALFKSIEEVHQLDYRTKFYQDFQQMLRKLRPIFQNEVCRNSSNKSFEFFGFDLLIDSDFRLYLLEVNLSAKCEERHPKLSTMLESMGEGILNIILKNPDSKGWKPLQDQDN